MKIFAAGALVLFSLLLSGCGTSATGGSGPSLEGRVLELHFPGGFDSAAGAIHANGNTRAAVQAEIASPEFIALLVRRSGIPEKQVRRYVPVLELSESGGTFHSTQTPPAIQELARRYVGMREAGHSRTYALARVAAEPDARAITPDSGALLKADKDVYLPWLWLYSFKAESGSNHTTYVCIDGELAWFYVVSRRPDRTLTGCYVDWCDAREILPAYQKTFLEVEAQVAKEMRAQGSWGKFGSCHVYWGRKQELLNQRGIAWKSPPDLHPGTNYD